MNWVSLQVQSVFKLNQFYSQNLSLAHLQVASPIVSPVSDRICHSGWHFVELSISLTLQAPEAICYDLLCISLVLYMSLPPSTVPDTEQKHSKRRLNAYINE